MFHKKIKTNTYDHVNQKPVVKCSICNGEQVAGFRDIHTGKFEEVMLSFKMRDWMKLHMTRSFWELLYGQANVHLRSEALLRKII